MLLFPRDEFLGVVIFVVPGLAFAHLAVVRPFRLRFGLRSCAAVVVGVLLMPVRGEASVDGGIAGGAGQKGVLCKRARVCDQASHACSAPRAADRP